MLDYDNVSRVDYTTSGMKRATLEIARNYEQALIEAGYSVLFNLDSSVERPQARRQWFNRVRSVVTQKVNTIEVKILNHFIHLLMISSGQLRNLGLI